MKKKHKHKQCSYLPINPAKPRKKQTIRAERNRRSDNFLFNYFIGR